MSRLLLFFRNVPHEPHELDSVAETIESCYYMNIDVINGRLDRWSFNKHVDLLYVDQLAKIGFSYISLRLDLETSQVVSDGDSTCAKS